MSPRLLIIEDDKDLAELITSVAQQEGVVAQHAATRHAIQTKSREFKPDFVVLDIVVPEMDAFEVMQWLKDHHPHAQIILISGHAEYLQPAAVMGRGLGLSILATLPKPFEMEEIRSWLLSGVRQLGEA